VRQASSVLDRQLPAFVVERDGAHLVVAVRVLELELEFDVMAL
jgi:hypothetical protein